MQSAEVNVRQSLGVVKQSHSNISHLTEVEPNFDYRLRKKIWVRRVGNPTVDLYFANHF